MLVILATWGSEIGRTVVPGQPGQKAYQTPISTNKKLGTVVHTCLPSYTGSINRRIVV
jgi:hypothetical protein